MTDFAVIIVWGSALLVAYVYAGYPILLWIITRFHRRPVQRGEITPAVTVIISAYNESEVIGAKLENTLSLDYPPERVEVLVVSDASTDETDSIVASFYERGVKLLRMPSRQGKTMGLNAAMQQALGEIVVFSDANIMYQPDVVRCLVRNFADASVGCVTGNSCYSETFRTAAHVQENSYWQYEQTIRALESELGSTVGGDGAIFAIRRDLYIPLSVDAINDLVVPLQIVARGYRAIFEPKAIGFEPSAGDFAGEFRRKRRIVNRSWKGVRSVPQVLHPSSVGVFAWQVWSHKVLRWLMLPVILAGAVACFVALPVGPIYRLGAFGFLLSLAVAAAGASSKKTFGSLSRVMQGVFYFYMVNLAALLGLVAAMFGRVEVLWTPERR